MLQANCEQIFKINSYSITKPESIRDEAQKNFELKTKYDSRSTIRLLTSRILKMNRAFLSLQTPLFNMLPIV